MRCISCGGAAHPATGAQYTVTAITCWRCTETFWKWVREQTSKRPSRRNRRHPEIDFYTAAGKWRHDDGTK